MVSRLVFATLVALTLVGCFRKPSPEETVDGWPIARAALTKGDQCFAGRADYCITDPEFVDAAIKPRLNDLYGGEMPPRKVHVDAVVRAAINEYRRALMKPENMLRVEELVKERYMNPKVDLVGDEVNVDMGVVPGRIEPAPATLALRMARSDFVDNGAWTEAEARKTLLDFAGRYRDRPRLRVGVTIARSAGLFVQVFRYLRAERRLVLYIDGEARTVPVDSDEALATVALTPQAMKVCEIVEKTRDGALASGCPSDPFADRPAD